MATIEEIIAMKLVIQGGGKKDFGIYMNYFGLMI
jgi:hypothetical protein